jgi:hypothetical protein
MELSDEPPSAEKPDTAKLHKDLDKIEDLLETKHGQEQSEYQRRIDHNTEQRRILAENAVLKDDLNNMKEQLKLLMQAAGGLTAHTRDVQLKQKTDYYQPEPESMASAEARQGIKQIPQTDYYQPEPESMASADATTPPKINIPAMNFPAMNTSIFPDSPDELFLQLEALNPLYAVDYQQHIITENRHTTDYHSLSNYYEAHDKVDAFKTDFDTVGGTALHSRINRFLSALSHLMKDPKDCKKTAAARRASVAAVRNRICLPVKVCTRPYTECKKQESA